jgi:hypothetical protein
MLIPASKTKRMGKFATSPDLQHLITTTEHWQGHSCQNISIGYEENRGLRPSYLRDMPQDLKTC